MNDERLHVQLMETASISSEIAKSSRESDDMTALAREPL